MSVGTVPTGSPARDCKGFHPAGPDPAMDEGDTVDRLRAVGVAAYVAGAGLVASLLVASVAISALGAETTAQEQVASAVGLGLGAATVVFFYLRWTGRPVAFLDVRRPDRRDVLVAVAGGVALAVVSLGLEALYGALGVGTATHGTVEALDGAGEGTLYVAVATSLLLVGPGEELLYRNVVQKSLYARFSRASAVAVASALFALAHAPAYAGGAATAAALAATLGVVLALSLVLGSAYALTDNVLVPAVLHGCYNAATFVEVILG